MTSASGSSRLVDEDVLVSRPAERMKKRLRREMVGEVGT
jgi:hypothetical protein